MDPVPRPDPAPDGAATAVVFSVTYTERTDGELWTDDPSAQDGSV